MKRKSNKLVMAENLIRMHIPLENFIHEMKKINVYVVRPGETVSSVFMMDEKRFFPRITGEDIVIGGFFG